MTTIKNRKGEVMIPADDPLEERRRSVAREEAQVIRAEVIRWVQEGEAGEELADFIGQLVRESLDEQVRVALSSEELAQAFGVKLSAELATRFADDLRSVITEEIYRVFRDEELAKLHREVLKMVRTAVVAETQRTLSAGMVNNEVLADLRRELSEEIRLAVAGRSPVGPVRSFGIGFPLRGRRSLWAFITMTVLLVSVCSFLIYWCMRRTPNENRATSPSQAAQTASAALAADVVKASGTAPVQRSPSSVAAKPREFFSVWQRYVAKRPPVVRAGIVIKSNDFKCWFPDDVRHRLNEFVFSPVRLSTDAQGQIHTAFSDCTDEYAPIRGVNYAVFAAQAAVQLLVTINTRSMWED